MQSGLGRRIAYTPQSTFASNQVASRMKRKRSPLYFSTLATLAFLVGAWLAWQRWGDEWQARTGQRPREESSIDRTATQPGTGGVDRPAMVPAGATGTLRDRLRRAKIPHEVLSQSSWQDPFEPDLWDAVGCSVAEDRLELNQDGTATFLRPYRRLRIEFSATSSVASESEHAWPAQFELHLLNPAADTATVLIMTEGEAAVAHRSGSDWSFVRRVPVAASLSDGAGTFRVNATGSRILVWRDNQILLNCPQPSSDGADLYVQFASRDGDLVVSRLRIEGE
ncbi:MAG: hypothetical protein O2820_14530 [Planctomycetota bacterium]|nr:hypothetical protein [Planctomycetota bacterium]